VTDIEAFINGIPKAEIHIHVDGSIEPELMFELAKKNNLPPGFASVDEAREAYNHFTDLESFLNLYFAATKLLQDEDDFYAVMKAYLKRARQDHVIHAEIFFEPQSHTMRGVSIDVVMSGMLKALNESEKEYGMSWRLIPCFLRNFSEEEAFRTLDEIFPYRNHIHAFGLDSTEVGHPPGKFARVFRRCKELGFHIVSHAGEEGPPHYVTDTLDLLKAERIDHGVRSIEDPALVKRLVDEQIPLTVCPLSNVLLRVFPTMNDHSIKKLMDAGVCVTVNSDDPAYFGGYINANYAAVQRAFDLSKDDIVKLARNSFVASFITEEERTAFLARIDAYAAQFV
jgi:adenosine deaminase